MSTVFPQLIIRHISKILASRVFVEGRGVC